MREQIKAGTVTEQEPMNKHTSFAIGGPADVFVQPATREEIRSAVYCAKKRDPFLLWAMEVTCWYRTKVFEE